MPKSYNGWSAAPGWSVKGGQLKPLVVAGESFSPGVRAGDVHDVLQYVAEQLHRRVEPVVKAGWHAADDWGYAYRANVNNPASLSCHASGTAIDYNATRHPNGKRGTWTVAQRAEIGRILAEVNNVVVNLAHDEMHFEIRGNAAQVAAAAAKIRGAAAPAASGTSRPTIKLGAEGSAVRALQTRLRDGYSAYRHEHGAMVVDGDFGKTTDAWVREFQQRSGLTVDGVVGPATWKALGL